MRRLRTPRPERSSTRPPVGKQRQQVEDAHGAIVVAALRSSAVRETKPPARLRPRVWGFHALRGSPSLMAGGSMCRRGCRGRPSTTRPAASPGRTHPRTHRRRSRRANRRCPRGRDSRACSSRKAVHSAARVFVVAIRRSIECMIGRHSVGSRECHRLMRSVPSTPRDRRTSGSSIEQGGDRWQLHAAQRNVGHQVKAGLPAAVGLEEVKAVGLSVLQTDPIQIDPLFW